MTRFARLQLPSKLRGGMHEPGESASSAAPTAADLLRAWQGARVTEDLKYALEWQQSQKRTHTGDAFMEAEPDQYDAEHENWAWRKNLHERNVSDTEFNWLKTQVGYHGLEVVLHLDPFPASYNDFWNEANRKNPDDSYAVLWQIRIEKGDHFLELSNAAQYDAPFDYHITLGYLNDLVNIRVINSEDRYQQALARWDMLRKRYDRKRAWLRGIMKGSGIWLDYNTHVQNVEPPENEHNLFEDLDLYWFCVGNHAARGMHMSM